MSTWVKVARFNLARPAYYLLLPWILPLAFALGVLTARRSLEATGYLLSYFIFFGVQGWQTVSRSLPFGLALGASRRSFYSGTALLGMALALASGLVLAALQAIERAAQVLVVVAGARVAAFEHWHFRSAVGGASPSLTALGLTGLVAALTVLLLVGGRATIRRVTV
jgi:hypothetical protein